MKKALVLALGLLLIPFTAFGMTALSDADMEEVSGQSGVAIWVDDILLYTEGVDDVFFQVADVDASGNWAAVGFKGLENGTASTTFINAIVSSGAASGNATNAIQYTGVGDMGLYMSYEFDDFDGLYELYEQVTGAQYDHDDHAGPLTITVRSNLQIFAAELANAAYAGTGAIGLETVAGVAIGLPSIEIYSQGREAREIWVSITDGLADGSQDDPGTDAALADDRSGRYGTLWTYDRGGMALLGGAVDIAPLENYTNAGGEIYDNGL